jgi:Fe-S cluster biogenesis protein NfuA/nitrite reductase/ring-hydroxylating ferredoxin subunit
VQDSEARERIAALERLLEGVELLEDEGARRRSTELVQALLELYGEGLERIVAVVSEHERAGELAEALGRDELVSHLLLLHDLHPVPVDERVREALEGVRPYLESHGGNVELVGVEEGVVRLRLSGSCNGCPSSTMTLKLAIEDAIQRMAPEVESVEAEGVSGPGPALLQLEVAQPLRGDWETVGGLPELRARSTIVKPVAGATLLFAALDENLYAYRDVCAGCGESLDGATLSNGELECPSCRRTFDVRRAGRCLEDPELSLEPVPLLTDDAGIVKVALPAGVS